MDTTVWTLIAIWQGRERGAGCAQRAQEVVELAATIPLVLAFGYHCQARKLTGNPLCLGMSEGKGYWSVSWFCLQNKTMSAKDQLTFSAKMAAKTAEVHCRAFCAARTCTDNRCSDSQQRRARPLSRTSEYKGESGAGTHTPSLRFSYQCTMILGGSLVKRQTLSHTFDCGE